MATINLDFYKGSDLYSDGDIENDIAAIVKEGKSSTEALAHETRWPVIYHLSPLRRNLLEWYNFPADSSILEVGAGCGALTELFCEKAKNVVAVELSKRRAEIIMARLKKKKNLSIYVGSIEDVILTTKFDIVTMIGVLEYAGSFIRSSRPYHAFLEIAKKQLKPGGTLVLALENRFGIKYWAGAREDHTGGLFDGIEGYPGNTSLMTFGKHELEQLLGEAGFSDLTFYYPMPDYKLPTEVFSDDFLPACNHFAPVSPNYDMDRYLLFKESLALNNIIKNSMFPFFANSFLVFCR
jgi:SAM-dependent methyltransferase